MIDTYRAHDAAIARGEGHEAGWKALMGHMVSHASPEASAHDVTRVVQELWNAQPARNLWRFVPDEARALLRELTDRGIRMVITSNSEGRVAELAAEVEIANHFRRILDWVASASANPIGASSTWRRTLLISSRPWSTSATRKSRHRRREERRRVCHSLRCVPPVRRRRLPRNVIATSYQALRAALLDALGLDA
jgi:hypothetical protein